MAATVISVNVLRNAGFGDCTNGGLTSFTHRFTLYATQRAYEEDESRVPHKSLICVHRSINGVPYVHCEPATERGGMFGGNYVKTSDSRYQEVTGLMYPIAVHDRFEPPLDRDSPPRENTPRPD